MKLMRQTPNKMCKTCFAISLNKTIKQIIWGQPEKYKHRPDIGVYK